MLLKLAWRNVWRNKRRTTITMASVLFAVLLSSLMMCLKEGVYEGMISSTVGHFSGYAQLQSKNYWIEKNLDNGFDLTESLDSIICNSTGIDTYLERLDGIALAISKDVSKVALVVGINTDKEASLNKLQERLDTGQYINPNDKSILIGNGLAKYLNLHVNDTLVLLGQGYHGAAAAGKYRVKGIVKFGSPELSKNIIFLPLQEAQSLYGMEGMITSMVLNFKNIHKRNSSMQTLQSKLIEDYKILGWEELVPEVRNLIDTDRVEGYVFMFILYLVVSFGILGTLLMMLAERTREFGVLVSLGMKRIKLAIIVWIELIMITVAGTLAGILLAFPIAYYFNTHPINLGQDLDKMMEEYGIEGYMRFSVEPTIFFQQALLVLIIACLISIYPIVKLLHLNAIKSMRS